MSGAPGAPGASGGPAGRRRAWWVVALLTGLVVASITAVNLVGGLAADRAYTARTFVHPVSVLRIDNTGGSVEVERGPAGRVTVRQSLAWMLHRPRIEHRWDGNTLELTVSCHDAKLLRGLDCHAGLRVLVPADTEVQSVATSGATTVSGIDGGLDLRADSGPINVTGAGGPVLLSTSSGPINAMNLRTAQVTARTGSGAVDLDFAAVPHAVTVSSSSGPVDVALPKGTRYRATAYSALGPDSVDDGLYDAKSPDVVTVTSASGPADIAYRP